MARNAPGTARSLAVTIVGFFALNVAARLLRDDARFQAMLSTTPAILGALLLCLVTNAALLSWHQRRHDAVSFALTVATLAMAPLLCGFQALAPSVGWWSGTAFRSSLASQALIYGVSLEGTVLAYLAIYHWAGRKHVLAGVVSYTLLLIASVVGTIYGDRYMLGRGTFMFSHGYSVVSDVIYCLCIYLIPLLIFELSKRRRAYVN